MGAAPASASPNASSAPNTSAAPASASPAASAAPASASPAATAASASGDPHMSNTLGQRFDIYKSGQMEFLRVPFESASGKADFTVLATIKGVSQSINKCEESRYITSLRFGGAWLGDKPLEVSMEQGRMIVLLGGVQMK